jgi:hypothetical protein
MTDVSAVFAAMSALKPVVVNFTAEQLQVLASQPANASGMLVDLSKIKDVQPPVLILLGPAYKEVLEKSRYADPGVSGYDRMDGNKVIVQVTVQLCNRPEHLGPAGSSGSAENPSISSSEDTNVTCVATVPYVDTAKATVDYSEPEGGFVYLVTYTGRDLAGNLAPSLRRYVTVLPRCLPPTTWCSLLSTCTLKGFCSSALAGLADSTWSSGDEDRNGPNSMLGGAAFILPPDRTPPKLRLLGSGLPGITPTGGMGLCKLLVNRCCCICYSPHTKRMTQNASVGLLIITMDLLCHMVPQEPLVMTSRTVALSGMSMAMCKCRRSSCGFKCAPSLPWFKSCLTSN